MQVDEQLPVRNLSTCDAAQCTTSAVLPTPAIPSIAEITTVPARAPTSRADAIELVEFGAPSPAVAARQPAT